MAASVLPTLLQKGHIVTTDKRDQARLSNMTGIEYILERVSDILPIKGVIKLSPRAFGDKVLVIKSGTGSGKSTCIPPELYLNFQLWIHNVSVTQPRILNAVNIPDQIVHLPAYNTLKLEQNIGFQTGDYSRSCPNGINFMTTGILLMQLMNSTNEEFMKSNDIIIVDEVHERDITADTMLYFLKKFLKSNWYRKECPIVLLMSATMDEQLFMQYFEVPTTNFIAVSGRSYPIQMIEPAFEIQNLIEYIREIIISIISNADEAATPGYRDIIIFVNGKTLIESLLELVNAISREHNTPLLSIALTSESFKRGKDEFVQTFQDINLISIVDPVSGKRVTPSRKIFIATNIAETGVTIDTLKYCIDTGLVNSAEYNPDFNCNVFIEKVVSHSASMQRRGRVGRKMDGIWYPCYHVEQLPPRDISQIIVSDISCDLLSIIKKDTNTQLIEESNHHQYQLEKNNGQLFLTNYISDQNWYRLASDKVCNIATIDFIETPSASSLSAALKKLYALGFIQRDYSITLNGYFATFIQKLPIESIRMILAGYTYGANVLDLITIASFLYGQMPSFDKLCIDIPQSVYDNIKQQLNIDPFFVVDDFIKMLLLWDIYANMCSNNTFDKKMMDIVSIFSNITTLRDEIINSFIMAGLNPYYNGLNLPKNKYSLMDMLLKHPSDAVVEIQKLKQCIYTGYYLNRVVHNNGANYTSHYNKMHIMLKMKPMPANFPKNIVTNAVTIRKIMNRYVALIKYVCILDCFVNPQC